MRMPGRPKPQKALREPRVWLALCRQCHEEMGDYSLWPLARQLACRVHWEVVRLVWVFNDLRGRAQTDMTVNDVLEWLNRPV